jgi:hypothetical protein
MTLGTDRSFTVMAGLVPATHEHPASPVCMDPRDKPGDDGDLGLAAFVLFVLFVLFVASLGASRSPWRLPFGTTKNTKSTNA